MLDNKLPPSPLLCSSCLSMVKNFDKFQSAAKAIREEFNSLRSGRLGDLNKIIRVRRIRFDIAENPNEKDESKHAENGIDWDLDLEDETALKSGAMSESEVEPTVFIKTYEPRDDEMQLKSEDDNSESLINFEFANADNADHAESSPREPKLIPPPQRRINLSRSLNLAKLGTLVAKQRYIAKSQMLTIISKPNDPKVEKIVKMFKPDTETTETAKMQPIAVTRKIPCEKCGKLFDEGNY